jgi:hypothetical protein
MLQNDGRSSGEDCAAIVKTLHVCVFVIPGLTRGSTGSPLKGLREMRLKEFTTEGHGKSRKKKNN